MCWTDNLAASFSSKVRCLTGREQKAATCWASARDILNAACLNWARELLTTEVLCISCYIMSCYIIFYTVISYTPSRFFEYQFLSRLWNNMNMHESLFHYVLMKRLASKVRAMDTEPMVHGSPWSSGCTNHAIEFSTDYSISMNHHEYSSDLISTLVAPNDDRRQFLWVFRCFPPSHCHHIRALRVVSCHVRTMWNWKRLATATWSASHSKPYILSDSLLTYLGVEMDGVTEMWRLELPWTLYHIHIVYISIYRFNQYVDMYISTIVRKPLE